MFDGRQIQNVLSDGYSDATTLIPFGGEHTVGKIVKCKFTVYGNIDHTLKGRHIY